VVRRRSPEFVGGWEGFPVDDLDLPYRLATAGPFLQITEPITTWHRSHGGQIVRPTDQINRPYVVAAVAMRGAAAEVTTDVGELRGPSQDVRPHTPTSFSAPEAPPNRQRTA
jgi:hypothetical protein